MQERVQAVLVYNDMITDITNETRTSWLRRLHEAVADAADEIMPDFPRMQFNHGLVDFSAMGDSQ